MYISLIQGTGIKTPNDAHKKLHKIFHDPTDKETCPRYIYDGSMIYVQSKEPPKDRSDTLVVTEYTMPTGKVTIDMTMAAVTRKEGRNHTIAPADYGTKLDAKFRSFMKSIGIEVLTASYKPCGFVDDKEHRTKLPKCRIIAKCECNDASVLEKFAVTGYGRAKYLGLGLPVIKATENADL